MEKREAEFEDERSRLGDRWRGVHEHIQKEINVRGRQQLFRFSENLSVHSNACAHGRQRGFGFFNSCVLDGKLESCRLEIRDISWVQYPGIPWARIFVLIGFPHEAAILTPDDPTWLLKTCLFSA